MNQLSIITLVSICALISLFSIDLLILNAELVRNRSINEILDENSLHFFTIFIILIFILILVTYLNEMINRKFENKLNLYKYALKFFKGKKIKLFIIKNLTRRNEFVKSKKSLIKLV